MANCAPWSANFFFLELVLLLFGGRSTLHWVAALEQRDCGALKQRGASQSGCLLWFRGRRSRAEAWRQGIMPISR